MKIGYIDVETTSVDPKTDQIIEICLIIQEGTSAREYVERFKPTVRIAAAAERVHGINKQDLKDCPTVDERKEHWAGLLGGCGILVAHNADFDSAFVQSNFGIRGEWHDTLKFGWSSPNGKKPNLGELSWACGIEMDESKHHGAEYDTQVLRQCYLKAIDYFGSYENAIKQTQAGRHGS